MPLRALQISTPSKLSVTIIYVWFFFSMSMGHAHLICINIIIIFREFWLQVDTSSSLQRTILKFSRTFFSFSTRSHYTKQKKRWCISALYFLLTSHIRGHLLSPKIISTSYTSYHRRSHQFNTPNGILLEFTDCIQQSQKLWKWASKN